MEKRKADQAVSCFKSGFSCSQAIFSTYGEQFGLDKHVALKISGTFGGGMAGMAETCGAVTGAFMVIGLKYGKIKPEDEESKRRAYALVKEFVKNFINVICPKLVKNAVEILEEIL